MIKKYATKISEEINVSSVKVESTIKLLEDGGTVPFIARYRKEATGGLDEVSITAIRDRLKQLLELDKRRATILDSLKEQKKLTDELKEQVLAAETMAVLEDIYLPYRPKRRTRATIAKEKGLEPLAEIIFEQKDAVDPLKEAEAFVDSEKKVESVEDALAGARDIIAEWVNENQEARARLRELFAEKGEFVCRVIKGKESAGVKFRDYFDLRESVVSAPSHRILAMRRGEKEGVLLLRILPPEELALDILKEMFVRANNECGKQVVLATQDCYKRLLSLSMETEIRMATKQRADEDAINVFRDNLRQLLMAAPYGEKRVMAIDPGFRTGCKVVCLDERGKLLHNETIYIMDDGPKRQEATKIIPALCDKYNPVLISIGNGTASRETEAFIRSLKLSDNIQVAVVSESGASIYSASEVAREEFPDKDVTVRGAISIGRRVMDPLAELVKIDPKSIGVGQYQHDVDQERLRESLDDVVISCVNQVGVEVNTASKQLLVYVAGIGPTRAQAIIDHRQNKGGFSGREDLKKISGMGPKAFEQAAGFLRVRNASNPLDASAVHPESYHVVESMCSDLKCSVGDLMKNATLRGRIDLQKYLTDTIGLPTLEDIIDELAKPGRDPREQFEIFQFKEGVEKPEDLKEGMKLPGIVTNITKFGCFVDVGVHLDGLVHISEMSDKFVKDPTDVVKVHQQVDVTVLDVDLDRKRIALSMKKAPRR